MQQPSRRDFLKLMATYIAGLAGLLGGYGMARFMSFQSEQGQSTEFDLGPADAFAVNSKKVVTEIPAIIARDAGGFTAMSLQCTHLGCTVEESADGFACPCHGSRYDSTGVVTRGPATRALPHLRTEVSAGGHLIVHKDEA
ncbi:MAG TPA: Rieske (2Fe-2S) protein [Anaerolineales bacterium]